MSWLRSVVVTVAAALAVAAGSARASAQDTAPITSGAVPSLAALNTQVRAGDVVYVTDASGSTLKGALTAVTDRSVEVRRNGGIRTIAASDIRRIQRQQPDSPLTGVWIGAAIGAVPGIYWLIADPNECAGLCAEEYAAIGVGAVVGGLIDRAIHRRVTVYQASVADIRSPRVAIAPWARHRGAGIRVSTTW